MEGGRSYDSLPCEIILRICSLLPLNCVFRLKCVCKAWSVLISEFGALHLKRLRETSRGIIFLQTHPNSHDYKISLEIRSLQVGGGFKTLLEKDVYTSNIHPQFRRIIGHVYSLDGLICFSDGQGFDIFNPTTGEFVSLPVLYNDCTFSNSRRSIIVFGFGFCPLTKQYKVLSIYSEFMAAVITVGHSNSSWRIIDIPTSYHFSHNETFCINGTLYWLDYHHIAAFNFSDETFQEISLPPQVDTQDLSKMYLAEHEEGRLCLVHFVKRNEEYHLDLDIYIMLENHQWEFRFRVLFEDFQQYGTYDSYPKCVSCLKIGKILVCSRTAKKWYLYDIKSKAFEFVDLKISSLGIMFGDVSLFEESFTPIFGDVSLFEESFTPICRS